MSITVPYAGDGPRAALAAEAFDKVAERYDEVCRNEIRKREAPPVNPVQASWPPARRR